MAQVIQFHCPCCGTSLRLPLAMAAVHGPCPHCGQEIVAPDPATGSAAGIFSPPEPEPVKLKAPEKPTPSPSGNPVPALMRPAPQPVPAPRGPSAAVLILSCLLAGVVSLVAGFMLGLKYAPMPPEPPKFPGPTIPVDPKPLAPEVKPAVGNPAPVKASAAAEATLRAFLEAPDWAARSAYVLHPEQTRGAMENYSKQHPDGPTEFNSITLQHGEIDQQTGSTLFIFQVDTDTKPNGIPVVLVETPQGWLVDWAAFVEFRDDWFKQFAEGPPGKSGRFHLVVSRNLEVSEDGWTENEHFDSYLLETPSPETGRIAYLAKSSPLAAELTAATEGGRIFTPVLELKKSEADGGRTYLEIVKILATDWRPRAVE